jgi:hypothetical protein
VLECVVVERYCCDCLGVANIRANNSALLDVPKLGG